VLSVTGVMAKIENGVLLNRNQAGVNFATCEILGRRGVGAHVGVIKRLVG